MDLELSARIASQNTHWKGNKPVVSVYQRSLFKKIWHSRELRPIAYLTGPRRTGKSELLKQILVKLIEVEKVLANQILYFEFQTTDKTTDIWEVFNYFVQEIASPNSKMYIFFDEIQFIHSYENTIKQIYDNYSNIKLFITGSLSLNYKQKMEESLSGRFFAFRLGYLNFEEYLNLSNSVNKNLFEKSKTETNSLFLSGYSETLNPEFKEFLLFKRLPEIVNYKLYSQKEYIKLYLQSVLNQSLNQDAMNYLGINKPQILNSLISWINQNNGGEFSLNHFAKEIGSSKLTIKNYADILEIMGLVHFLPNTLNPLKILNSRKKVYSNSAFSSLWEEKIDNLGTLVESYILDRLVENEEEVTFFRQKNKEVDFLLPNKKIAIEVKFRSQLKAYNYLKEFSQKNNYNPILITLNQASFSELKMIPACLY